MVHSGRRENAYVRTYVRSVFNIFMAGYCIGLAQFFHTPSFQLTFLKHESHTQLGGKSLARLFSCVTARPHESVPSHVSSHIGRRRFGAESNGFMAVLLIKIGRKQVERVGASKACIFLK